MLICIKDRRNDIHIVSYEKHSGALDSYKTYCEKTFTSKTASKFVKRKLITFAADNTFPGICQTCKHIYDDMFADDLNHFPTSARGSLLQNRITSYYMVRALPPDIKYESLMYKTYRKVSRARSRINNRVNK